MSDIHDQGPLHSGSVRSEDRPLSVIPVPSPRGHGSPIAGFFRWLFRTAFVISLGVNFLLLILVFTRLDDGGFGGILNEHYHSGDKHSKSKIAIIKLDGVIMEGSLGYVQKQIESAAEDDRVKAVVLRINSPGGSITASDDLHRRLTHLSKGTTPGHLSTPKPIVVSMASLAASGGYYVAMPADYLFAERSTITGSIGVYAAFPTIAKFADKYGFGMEVIKSDDLKDSGDPFKEMKPQEKQLWQDMVNHAFDQFLDVVAKGRQNVQPPFTREILREVLIEKDIPVFDKKGEKEKEVKYVRRRTDGGIFTADDALKYQLIDQIGYLEDAIKEAAKRASMGLDYKVIAYEKRQTLMDALLSSKSSGTGMSFDPAGLSQATSPRLWYLAPQSELAGIFAAMRKE